MDKRDDPAAAEGYQAWEARAEEWRRGMAGRDEVLGTATELMLDLAGVGPGSRVLDVAAGTGDQTLRAARRAGPAGSVLAIDIAPAMLAAAADAAREAGLANVTTRVMDAQRLDFEPNSFDAAICRNGLMLIPEPAKALAAIRRVLKTGGRFAAMVFGPAEKNPCQAITMAVARRSGRLPPVAPDQPGMFRLGDPGVLESAYRAAGFRDVAVHSAPLSRRFRSVAEAVSNLKDSLVMLQRQMDALSNEEREQIWAGIEQELRRFEGPDGFLAPGESLIAVGTK